MGRNPDGSITIRTLGDYREFGYTLSATCEGERCNRRTLAVTLEDLIRIFGPEWDAISHRLPIKCTVCGSNRISYIVNTNRMDSRTLGHST